MSRSRIPLVTEAVLSAWRAASSPLLPVVPSGVRKFDPVAERLKSIFVRAMFFSISAVSDADGAAESQAPGCCRDVRYSDHRYQ